MLIFKFGQISLNQLQCRVTCKQRSADVNIEKWYSNAVATKQPNICCMEEATARENERLRDLDNNVPRAA
jgi:hypothetical protein